VENNQRGWTVGRKKILEPYFQSTRGKNENKCRKRSRKMKTNAGREVEK